MMINDSDYDGAVKRNLVLCGKRKRRHKKKMTRFGMTRKQKILISRYVSTYVLKMCTRRALSQFHVVQLRNCSYWKNCKDGIIVHCKVDGCPFMMTTSQIRNDKTFTIRKLRPPHTCPTDSENTKMTAD